MNNDLLSAMVIIRQRDGGSDFFPWLHERVEWQPVAVHDWGLGQSAQYGVWNKCRDEHGTECLVQMFWAKDLGCIAELAQKVGFKFEVAVRM